MNHWPQLIRQAAPSAAAPAKPIEEAGQERPIAIDDELDAQKRCYDALSPLDSSARARVLRWLSETLEIGR